MKASFFSFFLKKKGIWLANIMEVKNLKKSQFLHLLGSKIALKNCHSLKLVKIFTSLVFLTLGSKS